MHGRPLTDEVIGRLEKNFGQAQGREAGRPKRGKSVRCEVAGDLARAEHRLAFEAQRCLFVDEALNDEAERKGEEDHGEDRDGEDRGRESPFHGNSYR